MSERTLAQQQKIAIPDFTPLNGSILQRKCACGRHTVAGSECAECRKKRLNLQRQIAHPAEPAIVPPIVHEVLRSPGRPLDPATRAFMEPRFGHDFSQVRVHVDGKASESARAVNALAYTAGRDVVFDTGQYAIETPAGKRLLAHELTHVVQQGKIVSPGTSLTLLDVDGRAEDEADVAAYRIVADKLDGPVSTRSDMVIQRKVKVDKPDDKIPKPGGKGLDQTNSVTVRNYLTTLCSGGSVSVTSPSGEVSIDKAFCTVSPLSAGQMGPPTPAPAFFSKQRTGCGCLCDLVYSTNLWMIQVDDAKWPHTIFDDHDAAIGKKPGGTGGTVTTPSPNSPKLWGAATVSGKALNIDPWLVLGHELCGHGWLGNSGLHGPDEASPRGAGGHQETVKRENELRKEHGIELRGTFKEPHCGESFWRDKKSPRTVNWSTHRMVCETWRKEYNKKHGTSYKITDRIP